MSALEIMDLIIDLLKKNRNSEYAKRCGNGRIARFVLSDGTVFNISIAIVFGNKGKREV